MTRVTYGVRSSAHHSVKVLEKTADLADNPDIATIIRRDFAVDDLLTGAYSYEEATIIQDGLKDTLAQAGLCLRKWSSNDRAVIQRLPDSLQEQPSAYVFNDHEHTIKVLGIKWVHLMDHFTYTVEANTFCKPSKRQMLSDISRLYDPLGWVTPVIIVFKVLIQRSWLAGIDWDSSLPDSILQDWTEAREGLSVIAQLKIPRHIGYTKDGELTLHVFCDASETAYAAVVYTRCSTTDGVQVQLLTAKSKVAPVKSQSLPRLELCAAQLGARLIAACKKALCTVVSHDPVVHAWSGSTIVVSWLPDYPSKWSCFVGNRTSGIQDTPTKKTKKTPPRIAPTQWRHVPSEENPADCATRGIRGTQLLQHPLWWNGPTLVKSRRN